MLTFRTPTKDDFFESRIETKPKPQLSQLIQSVETLNQDIAECDQEINRWTNKKHQMRSQVRSVVEKVKRLV
jgi:uncharacterized coiled-coil DUF342 family protein